MLELKLGTQQFSAGPDSLHRQPLQVLTMGQNRPVQGRVVVLEEVVGEIGDAFIVDPLQQLMQYRHSLPLGIEPSPGQSLVLRLDVFAYRQKNRPPRQFN